jgi:hypothetical protein
VAVLKSQTSVALYLVAIVIVRHYGAQWFDPEIRGAVSKGLGGLAMLAVVPLLYRAAPSRLVAWVLAVWSFEALQIALCSFGYALEPWPVLPGQPICSAKIGFDLGALGILIIAAVLLSIVKAYRAQNQGGRA